MVTNGSAMSLGSATIMRSPEFVIESELHCGSLGALYVASAQGEDAARFVVRRFSRPLLADSDGAAMIRRESALGQRVRSPHVVCHVPVEGREPPFSVMELVEGITLAELQARAGRGLATARYVLPLLVDAATGLADLHALRDDVGRALGAVHQAPVARHILAGLDGAARLCDLSLAVWATEGSLPGIAARLAPAEMAPEQALAPEHVDARCDVFILSSLVWEALTGGSLFAAPDPEQALQRMLRMPIPKPSDLGVSLSPALERLVMRGLTRPRGDRLGSAAELAQELRAAALSAGLWADRQEIAQLVASLQRPRMLTPTEPPAPSAVATRQQTLLGYAPLPASAPLPALPAAAETQPLLAPAAPDAPEAEAAFVLDKPGRTLLGYPSAVATPPLRGAPLASPVGADGGRTQAPDGPPWPPLQASVQVQGHAQRPPPAYGYAHGSRSWWGPLAVAAVLCAAAIGYQLSAEPSPARVDDEARLLNAIARAKAADEAASSPPPAAGAPDPEVLLEALRLVQAGQQPHVEPLLDAPKASPARLRPSPRTPARRRPPTAPIARPVAPLEARSKGADPSEAAPPAPAPSVRPADDAARDPGSAPSAIEANPYE